MLKFLFPIAFLLINSAGTMAQERASVSGRITDNEKVPLLGITVYLEGTALGMATDLNGEFEIKGVKPGEYTLVFSAVGFRRVSQQIFLTSGEGLTIDGVLEEESLNMDEMVVFGKSEATKIRELAYAIEVVEAESFKNLSSNGNDILGKVSGVNIRQSGGMGSPFTLSLNGLSGNQVKVFLDGVPMDYFGSSLSLNNFSANLIERIEVYKGVVPIHLSSDALGGAINVVTSNKFSSYLDASYSVGSFGTHIASINAQYRDSKSGFTTRIKSFYNYSDNNYKVPIKLVNFDTGKEDENPTYVERFHDAYESRMVWLESGFVGTGFADQLMFGIMLSDNYNEVQQSPNAIGQAKIPYGEVNTQEEKLITNIFYRKEGLLDNRLNVNGHFVALFGEGLAKDTSSYTYDWFGNKELRLDLDRGEIETRKTLFTIHRENYLGNLYGEFILAKNQSLAANYTINYNTMWGSDPLKNENNTQFADPSDLNKQVFAGNYTRLFFGGTLKSSIFTKYYTYKLSSTETNYQGTETTPISNFKDYVGIGITGTYQMEHLQFKASFENALRFPEEEELFGDGLNIEANPGLNPEQSKNYNLGLTYSRYTPIHSILVTTNFFVRDIDNYILGQVEGIKLTYINYAKVINAGVDLSAKYSFRNRFITSWNASYLEKRDNNKWRNGVEGQTNNSYGVRIPNEPFLFGNVSFSYQREDFFKKTDSFSFTASESYTHEFYYQWENIASAEKAVVPEQWSTQLEMVYGFANDRITLSATVSNLLDAKVYDNYQQLRPGRAYNLKIRYLIN